MKHTRIRSAALASALFFVATATPIPHAEANHHGSAFLQGFIHGLQGRVWRPQRRPATPTPIPNPTPLSAYGAPQSASRAPLSAYPANPSPAYAPSAAPLIQGYAPYTDQSTGGSGYITPLPASGDFASGLTDIDNNP